MKKILLFMALLGVTQPIHADLQTQVEALCREVAAPNVPRVLSLTDAQAILQSYGYVTEMKSADKLTIMVNGNGYSLYAYTGGDFQMYYGFTGYNVTAFDLNDWNAQKRLSRAYIDGVKDPVIESDLEGSEGLTQAQLLQFVKVFIESSVPAYREFLKGAHKELKKF